MDEVGVEGGEEVVMGGPALQVLHLLLLLPPPPQLLLTTAPLLFLLVRPLLLPPAGPPLAAPRVEALPGLPLPGDHQARQLLPGDAWGEGMER